MYLFDVNIYVHMHREDSSRHKEIYDFMTPLLQSGKAFGYSPLALSGFLHVVTHKKIFTEPTPFDKAMAFTEAMTAHPCARHIIPGPAHWQIFRHLCYENKPEGNLYPDVFFAALAIESGCTLVSCDKDYLGFKGLDCQIL